MPRTWKVVEWKGNLAWVLAINSTRYNATGFKDNIDRRTQNCHLWPWRLAYLKIYFAHTLYMEGVSQHLNFNDHRCFRPTTDARGYLKNRNWHYRLLHAWKDKKAALSDIFSKVLVALSFCPRTLWCRCVASLARANGGEETEALWKVRIFFGFNFRRTAQCDN